MKNIAMDGSRIPEERRFVWRNLEGFIAGELSSEDRARIEEFLCDCPHTREYVETEKQFAEALRRCVNEDSVACPEGLRTRVLDALERCELDALDAEKDAKRGRLIGFPWLGATVAAAASVMLVVALTMFFGGGTPQDASPPSLPDGLAPMVTSISMEAPRSEKCRYRDANTEYTRHFVGAPELPHLLDGRRMRLSHWSCDEVNGHRVMRAVYDTPDGERFGLMVIDCACLEKHLSSDVRCAEVMVDGKVVLLWREGDYFRALVGADAASLQRYMQMFRKPF